MQEYAVFNGTEICSSGVSVLEGVPKYGFLRQNNRATKICLLYRDVRYRGVSIKQGFTVYQYVYWSHDLSCDHVYLYSSIFLLLLIIYYFFAILGMEFSQGRVYEDCCQLVNKVITYPQTALVKLHSLHFLHSNASYNVGDYYTGSLNETTIAVYYLNSFNNLLRSYSV